MNPSCLFEASNISTTISINMKKLKPGEIYAHKTRDGKPTGWQFRKPQPSAKEIADEAKYPWARALVAPENPPQVIGHD